MAQACTASKTVLSIGYYNVVHPAEWAEILIVRNQPDCAAYAAAGFAAQEPSCSDDTANPTYHQHQDIARIHTYQNNSPKTGVPFRLNGICNCYLRLTNQDKGV